MKFRETHVSPFPGNSQYLRIQIYINKEKYILFNTVFIKKILLIKLTVSPNKLLLIKLSDLIRPVTSY